MLWFLILLFSSFSQGPFSQFCNLPLQPLSWGSSDNILAKEKLHLPCSRSEQCPLLVFVLLQVLVLSAVFLGFSQPLLAVLLPRDAAPDPENVGVCHFRRGVTEKKPVEETLVLTFLPPEIRLGLGLCLHEHFFGTHTAYAILTSFHPLLLWHFCGTTYKSHQRTDLLKAELS